MADINNADASKKEAIVPGFTPKTEVKVGGLILKDEPINYNEGRYTAKIVVHNTGDRPVQVGSHFHFFEVNRYLEFDRSLAFGCHLNIPSTSAIRFEPGDEREVEVVAYAGKRYVMGFNGLVNGYTGTEDEPTYYPKRLHATRMAEKLGFKMIAETDAEKQFEQYQQEHADKQKQEKK
ncbi:MAG: urease subunit beta [Marinifilaceae bacterium]